MAEHKEIMTERSIAWAKSHPEKIRITQEKWRKNHPGHSARLNETLRRRLKRMVLIGYGCRCVCCGDTHPEFLTVDHIHGGGTADRKRIGGSVSFYKWLVENDYPKDAYRLLCMNCNHSRGLHGYCPHESPSKYTDIVISQG